MLRNYLSLMLFISYALGESWQDRHMREEHNINSYDAKSFFLIHDSDNSGFWTRQDILSIYGVLNPVDPTGHRKDPITPAEQEDVYQSVLKLTDLNHDGSVSLDEWLAFSQNGNSLPDLGFGAGHHGDVEYEYELHHWLKYHADDDNDENLNHPEDIEHERLFHHMEDKQIEDEHTNIPLKFRVQN
ncbi:uncharacterized protein V1516DRAFT_670211 [Lipomyces oligophaga]|uniref:uncharacterized protein n=1 Tax=Lipomyces oligophaga TaxID=45792 RepID=UPI0034CF8423